MGLSDRLAAVERQHQEAAANGQARTLLGRSDVLEDIKRRAVDELFDRIGARINDSSITETQLREFVRSELSHILEREQVQLSPGDRRELVREIEDDALGLGPVQRLLEDPTVSEIMVNHAGQIYVERSGRLELTDQAFESEQQLRRVIERIVARVGRRIDEASPLVDARLPDGSRVNAVIPPLAVRGSSLTIRKFSRTPLTVNDLIGLGSLTDPMADLLELCVRGELNILISGGTGTGKTTLLNVLSSFIPDHERIVTIEDAVELQLQQHHVIQLESRPPNIEGRGEVTIRELVRNSLRMRPDRIVVGECRGGEALDMLQAMNTGHDGSITTLHANSPADAVTRLETLVLMAGMDLPMKAIHQQVGSAIDLVLQISRLRNGARIVTHLTEVVADGDSDPRLVDLLRFDLAAGYDDDGTPRGSMRLVGELDHLNSLLAERGAVVPHELIEKLREVDR